MKKYRLIQYSLMILLFCGCENEKMLIVESENESKSMIEQMVITSSNLTFTDVLTSYYDYVHMEKDISEISKSGLKWITYERVNGKLVEKKYFNNLEELSSIDSFFYDAEGKLELVKTYNPWGWNVGNMEWIYHLGRVSKFVDTALYPSTIIEEYEVIYSGSNIESLNLKFGNTNITTIFEYDIEKNIQNLDFYLDVLGVYKTGIYGLNTTNLAIAASANRVKSVRGYYDGVLEYQYIFKHVISNDQYSTLDIKDYGKNQELRDSTNIVFIYKE